MTDLVPVSEDQRTAILRYLKLDPADVATHALLLICERYGLDPLMKHMVLITGKPYITRDGYLHIAHRSQVFDGIEVMSEHETDTHYVAKVSVYRKDMGRPFTYSGRYPKSGQQKQYGPEMAVKTAEVMALRRAFNVTGVGAAEEQWDDGLPEPVTGVACPKCGVFVEGDPADRETLRAHLIGEHGHVRLEDGTVVAPTPLPLVASGEGQGDEPAASQPALQPPPAQPDVIDPERSERLVVRSDKLPDELRREFEGQAAEASGSRYPHQMTEADFTSVASLLAGYEAQINDPSPEAHSLAGRAKRMAQQP